MVARGKPHTAAISSHWQVATIEPEGACIGEIQQLMVPMACTKPLWLHQKMVTEKLQFQGDENQPCIFSGAILRHNR